MMKINFFGKIIVSSYLFLILIFTVINFLIHIVSNKIANWEFFSYNFFGSIIVYLLVSIFCYLLFMIFPKVIYHPVYGLFFLLIFLELSFFLISGTSLSYVILKYMVPEKNYIMLFYPLCLILVVVFMGLKYRDKMVNVQNS